MLMVEQDYCTLVSKFIINEPKSHRKTQRAGRGGGKLHKKEQFGHLVHNCGTKTGFDTERITKLEGGEALQ